MHEISPSKGWHLDVFNSLVVSWWINILHYFFRQLLTYLKEHTHQIWTLLEQNCVSHSINNSCISFFHPQQRYYYCFFSWIINRLENTKSAASRLSPSAERKINWQRRFTGLAAEALLVFPYEERTRYVEASSRNTNVQQCHFPKLTFSKFGAHSQVFTLLRPLDSQSPPPIRPNTFTPHRQHSGTSANPT